MSKERIDNLIVYSTIDFISIGRIGRVVETDNDETIYHPYQIGKFEYHQNQEFTGERLGLENKLHSRGTIITNSEKIKNYLFEVVDIYPYRFTQIVHEPTIKPSEYEDLIIGLQDLIAMEKLTVQSPLQKRFLESQIKLYKKTRSINDEKLEAYLYTVKNALNIENDSMWY